MIIFDLICPQEHRFEGWFQGAASFDQQLAEQLVRCPQCDSVEVRKVPSAVAIGSGRCEPAQESASTASVSTTSTAMPAPTLTEVLGLYKQLSKALLAVSEDVGTAFAEEARRMHYEEIPERAIRGQSTRDEIEELADEGIAVLRLPIIKDEELN